MASSDRYDKLKEQVALLPLSPGVYQFVDRTGTIIYVGKAKSLRKRVSSYFVQSKEHSAKVRVMVRQIVEIRHIVVGSETDALLLENSLIKSLQPRYNILLKDDKTYPWIVVRREPFPRVQSTRQLVRDGSQYFGPYGSVMMQHSVLDFIREVVPLRTCKLNLSPSRSRADAIRSACSTTWATARAPASGRRARRSTAAWWIWSLRCCGATCARCANTSRGRCREPPRSCASRWRNATSSGSTPWTTMRAVR